MKPDLAIVIAHGAASEAFHFCSQFWRLHDCPIEVICPENDPVKCTAKTHLCGQAQHAGKQALLRLRLLLDLLHKQEWSKCVVFEYDSFFTTPDVPDGAGFWGSLTKNNDPLRFMAPVNPNPPWVFDRQSFFKMHQAAIDYPNVTEHGYADRFLGALAYLARVPMFDYTPPGFTRAPLTENDLIALWAAKLSGTTAFHGIKTPAARALFDK